MTLDGGLQHQSEVSVFQLYQKVKRINVYVYYVSTYDLNMAKSCMAENNAYILEKM